MNKCQSPFGLKEYQMLDIIPGSDSVLEVRCGNMLGETGSLQVQSCAAFRPQKDTVTTSRLHFSSCARNVTNATLNEDVGKNVDEYFKTLPSCLDGTEEHQEHQRTRLYKLRKSFFPLGFCYELKHLLRLAIPIAVTSLLTFTFGPVSIAFCGHLGQTELAAIGLATSIYNMAGTFVVTGLLTASDTLFAQTYGSKRKQRICTEAKKTLVLITICCLPCCALYICVEPLLLIVGQNPQIAKMTADFLLRLIPALLLIAWGQVLTRYIQNQNHVYAPLMLVILTNGVNALLHYLFLFYLKMGINGSALAQTLAFLFQDICFLLYIQCSKSIINLNAEPSTEFLQAWGSWLRLAIPGLIMVCLEGTLFELGGIVAGSIGERELAVQTVLITLDTISYTLLPCGFGTAAGIRVGQYLGGQIPLGPRSILSVGLLILWIIAPFYFGITMAIRWHIPHIFSNDPEVIQMTASLIPLTSAFQILDGTNGIGSGVLRGAGLQRFGAVVNVVSLYLIGAPISLCLVYFGRMSIKGIWIGLIVGTGIQIIFFLVVCYRTDWNKQVENTLKRLNKQGVNFDGGIEINDSATESHVTQEDTAQYRDPILNKEPEVSQYSVAYDKSIVNEKANSFCGLLLKRLLTICAILSILIASICCRCFLHLSDYFGPYCLFANGTFAISSNHSTFENCTLFFP